MNVRPYTHSDAPQWDEFVNQSPVGTFLHTRRFLSYHGEKFVDVSLVVEDDRKHLIGLLPAAIDPESRDTAVSHPGISYGGLVVSQRSKAGDLMQMLRGVLGWYRQAGFARLIYKTVPIHLHSHPSQIDQYALWRAKGEVVRRDIWNVIPLNGGRKLSDGCRWAIGRAAKNGISTHRDNSSEAYSIYHAILTQCLADRHSVDPVHTRAEMLALQERFPQEIELWLARDREGTPLGGVWIFKTKGNVWHTQYIASTALGRELFALNLLIENIVQAAEKEAVQHVSFGASTYANGTALNEGLFAFKAGFGFGTVVQDFYSMDLGGQE